MLGCVGRILALHLLPLPRQPHSLLKWTTMEATTQVRQTKAWKALCCNGARKLLQRLVLKVLPCCGSLPACLPAEKAPQTPGVES